MLNKKVLLLIIFITAVNIFALNESDYKKLRKSMVKYQIEYRSIKDKKVLNAMLNTPRHMFVPGESKKYAYEDRPLSIGYGQTISQPYIVALMTELIKINNNSKVLEIGTGSGYQAAILSLIAKDVFTVEIYEALSKRAKEIFKMLNYNNIKTKADDGYYGWEENAPYDAIIVTCAPTFVPPPLIKQLKVGGLMVIPVGPPFTVQKLLLIKKINEEKVQTEVICGVSFVPLIREAD